MPRDELTPTLKQAAADLAARLQKSAANPLQDMLRGVDEPNRQAIRNALIGALIGGVGGAGYGAAADPEDRVRGALQNLLTGAALGGTAAGAGTVGLNLLTGKTKLPGEERRVGPISGVTNLVGGAIAGHPATIGAGLGGAFVAAKKGPSYGNLLRIVNESKLRPLREQQVAVADLAKQPSMIPVAMGAAGRSLRELAGIPRKMWAARKAGLPSAVDLGLEGAPQKVNKIVQIKNQLQAALKAGPEELKKVLNQMHNRAVGLHGLSRATQAARLIGPAHVPSRLWWAAAPLSLGAGYYLDKYIKGDY